jgi:hypothetical protein
MKLAWDAEHRRAYAIARTMERARAELAPGRAEIAALVDALGWRRARPAVWQALGRPVQRRGLWSLGKKDTARVLAALRAVPRQQSFWDRNDGSEAR